MREHRREPSARAGWLIVIGFLLGLGAVIGLQLADDAQGGTHPAPAVTRTVPGPTATVTATPVLPDPTPVPVVTGNGLP